MTGTTRLTYGKLIDATGRDDADEAHDFLQHIADALEDLALQLSTTQPAATATVRTWYDAAGVLRDIIADMTDDDAAEEA